MSKSIEDRDGKMTDADAFPFLSSSKFLLSVLSDPQTLCTV